MSRFGRFLAITLVAAAALARAATTCSPAAVPALVRAEGLSEPVGDILLTCNGAPGDTFGVNFAIFLTDNITNRIRANGDLDIVLTIDGTAPSGFRARPHGANGVEFQNLQVAVSASGTFALRVTNLRAAIAQQPNTDVQANLSFSPASSIGLTTASVTVARPRPSLLATINSAFASCTGSPLPESMTLPGFAGAGTSVFTTRVTEGIGHAFERNNGTGDSGVRILLRYTGWPSQARLFVPDFVAGSTALAQTSAGDLTLPAAAGRYEPSAEGSLLLARVPDADANGAGGTPQALPSATPPLVLESVSEVELADGAGVAVYEVLDSDTGVVENAHIPTFVGFPRTGAAVSTDAALRVSYGPLSDVAIASATAPIPRFADVTPELDCGASGDCDAFPRMVLDIRQPFTFTAPAGSYKRWLTNGWHTTNGRPIDFSATLTYLSGSGWARIETQQTRPGKGWVLVEVDPSKVPAGVYEATLTLDGGPISGVLTLPVKFTVTSAPAPTAPEPPPPSNPAGPTIASAVNAASFLPGGMQPGSLATVFGSNLGGTDVLVTLDGLPAPTLYTSAGQINLLVPAELGLRPTAQLVVNVDGQLTPAMTIHLVEMSPAVFNGGILNQDNIRNAVETPADAGSIIQIWATGLPTGESGTMFVKLAGREIGELLYGGPAPGIPGVEQINVRVPADLGSGTTELVVCGVSKTSGERVCSPAAPLSVRQ